jgi:hypothetical protein
VVASADGSSTRVAQAGDDPPATNLSLIDLTIPLSGCQQTPGAALHVCTDERVHISLPAPMHGTHL